MKKIAIVLFVAAAALSGCSKKNGSTTPTAPAAGSGDMGSGAAPAGGGGDMGGGGGSGGM